MTDLSILIPSRNEMFLKNTIDDILRNMRGDTEIIAVLDGEWADPPIDDDERVTLLYYPQSIGQRAATNAAAKISTARYVMKADAHCAFDEGFDVKLMATMQDDWTVAPLMRNLHAFDWVCPNGHRRYQGPSGECTECGLPTMMDILWRAKPSPNSTSYCFDTEPHFQYFGEFKKRPGGRGDITESMSLQGSCFMMTRDRYFDLNVCDEEFGSWGQQGIEVAVKTWLSGGRVMVNQTTWYAHMFRTQGGDFSFPYPLSGSQVSRARKMSREVFFENKWPKQVHNLSWLVERFWPVPGWTDEDLAKLKESDRVFGSPAVEQAVSKIDKPSKGVIYYTDNQLDRRIMDACQERLRQSTNGHKVVSVSLAPLYFGDRNIVLDLERGYLTMFKQILAGLEASDADIIFFCEHDVLYPAEHFAFVPSDRDKFYYNINVWKVDSNGEHYLHYDCKQTSGLVAYRDLLIEHYRKRVANTQAVWDREGGNTRGFRDFIRRQGFEPGTHGRAERVDDYGSESFWSDVPLVDIRHNSNLTPSRWSQEQFRDKRNCRNWIEGSEVPGWGRLEEYIR
jgi:glycosyltransferase involved in cell wall biosynthesis